MNIYCFSVSDEKPKVPNDWKYWYLIIPFNGKFPRKGDRVIILKKETDSEYVVHYSAEYETIKWPLKMTSEMMRHILRKIFKKLRDYSQ